MNAFLIYNLMYLVLEELYEENQSDNLNTYLSEASPYIWVGEVSADPIIYNQFKELYLKDSNNGEEYGYDFICVYLKELDPYYGDIYSIFKSLSKEEYVDTCNHIIKEQPHLLKKLTN